MEANSTSSSTSALHHKSLESIVRSILLDPSAPRSILFVRLLFDIDLVISNPFVVVVFVSFTTKLLDGRLCESDYLLSTEVTADLISALQIGSISSSPKLQAAIVQAVATTRTVIHREIVESTAVDVTVRVADDDDEEDDDEETETEVAAPAPPVIKERTEEVPVSDINVEQSLTFSRSDLLDALRCMLYLVVVGVVVVVVVVVVGVVVVVVVVVDAN